MRHLILRLVVTLLAVGLLAGFAPALVVAAPNPIAAEVCQSTCYKQKSKAFQKCRATIDPKDRTARRGCFKSAKVALDRCLASCSASVSPF